MKIIISTGQGRLHLIDSASAIKNSGVTVQIITGWIPSNYLPNVFLNFLGIIIGRNNLAYGLRKRRLSLFTSKEIHTNSFSEFFFQFLSLLSKWGLLKHEKSATWGWKMFGWQTKRYLKNADIFHVRSGAGQGGAIKKAKKMGMKIVVDHSIAHPSEVYHQLLKAQNGISNGILIRSDSEFWKLVLTDCEEADKLLVNSNYVKQSFINNGYDPSRICVVPLGVRKDFMCLKKDYLIEGRIKLLFTGSFGRRKGAHLISDAYELLSKLNDIYHLSIIGDIMKDFDLPLFFNNQPNIKLYGHLPQDDLKSYLIQSDIYIFPSYCEGAAQSLKEAMAIGLPVIATEQSGAPIVHGKNGWIIPDNSVNALVEAIITLSGDKVLRSKLGTAAAESIKEKHTWEKYGLEVNKLYSKLLRDT